LQGDVLSDRACALRTSRQQGTACTLDPNLPNARQPFSQLSGDVRMADLPELSIVVR
jgi:hypothetical protein